MPSEKSCNSPAEGSQRGCVLTSRKRAVNFYVWHVVIDFPMVPETGKPSAHEGERERERGASERKSERRTR